MLSSLAATAGRPSMRPACTAARQRLGGGGPDRSAAAAPWPPYLRQLHDRRRGVNAKALSTFMGHSSIKVTFDLSGHPMPGTANEAAALLDSFLRQDHGYAEEQVRAATWGEIAGLQGRI